MNHPAIAQRQQLESPAQPHAPEFAFAQSHVDDGCEVIHFHLLTAILPSSKIDREH